MRTGRILTLSVLLLVVALTGCGQHSCLPEGCLGARGDVTLDHCEHPPDAPAPHTVELAGCQTVSTVLNPEAPKRELSLQECFALALEKGRVGGTNIRVLSYDPAIAYTAIEQGLSRFDARFTAGMGWSQLDERAGNVLSSIPLGLAPTVIPSPTGVGVASGVGPAVSASVLNLVGVNNVQGAAFSSKLEKPLPTGGIAGITFLTDYTLVNQPPPQANELNPTYRTRLIFGLEQPLLRGFGVGVNQAPILIARLSFDQEREKFFGAVNQLLFAVEQAYWNLYFSYWNLHTLDVGLRQAHAAWEFGKEQQAKGLTKLVDLANLELTYQALRLARLDALGGQGRSVLEAERQLRFVVGLPPEDGHRLIPTDTPTTAPYVPDWQTALAAALDNRPELAQLRQQLKQIHLDMKVLRNQTLPDLRVAGNYDINGLGNALDGSGQNNALRSLASNHFNNWSVGMTLEVPIGFRAANSQLRRAQLQLAQRTVQLKDMEKQAAFALQQSFRELLRASEEVRIRGSVRKAANDRYDRLYELFRANLEGPNFLLLAQQNRITALSAEQSSIFAYNIALAKFELEKGTIQEFDNVSISDGPLPACVQARASAHIKERQQALVLRERPGAPNCAKGAPAALLPAVSAAPPAIATLNMQTAPPADVQQTPAAATGFLPPTRDGKTR